jgi:hypothetical protein
MQSVAGGEENFLKEKHNACHFSFVSTSMTFKQEMLFVLKYRLRFVTNTVIKHLMVIFKGSIKLLKDSYIQYGRTCYHILSFELMKICYLPSDVRHNEESKITTQRKMIYKVRIVSFVKVKLSRYRPKMA